MTCNVRATLYILKKTRATRARGSLRSPGQLPTSLHRAVNTAITRAHHACESLRCHSSQTTPVKAFGGSETPPLSHRCISWSSSRITPLGCPSRPFLSLLPCFCSSYSCSGAADASAFLAMAASSSSLVAIVDSAKCLLSSFFKEVSLFLQHA